MLSKIVYIHKHSVIILCILQNQHGMGGKEARGRGNIVVMEMAISLPMFKLKGTMFKIMITLQTSKVIYGMTTQKSAKMVGLSHLSTGLLIKCISYDNQYGRYE